MNLLWILSGALEQREGRLFSALGSHRLRGIGPATALKRLGHRIAMTQAETLAGKLEAPDLRAADIAIVAKQFTDVAPVLRAVKRQGPLVVIDVCDDVFSLEHLRATYSGLLDVADACTASSPVLADRIRAHYGRAGRDVPVAVVPDCVEGEALLPLFQWNPGRPLRLLWFGQPANLDALEAALPGLGRLASRIPLALTIVTKLVPRIAERFPERRDGLSIHWLPWSPETMGDALRDCDLVVVPSLPTEDKLAKSSNRVASALWAGRLPVAFPLPSYRPFARSALLTESLADGVAWTLAYPAEVTERIAEGQALIRRLFTPAAVAERWHAVLTEFLQNRPTRENRGIHACE